MLCDDASKRPVMIICPFHHRGDAGRSKKKRLSSEDKNQEIAGKLRSENRAKPE